MNDKPIIFSAPMVRAILDGRKTQTRRIVKDVNPSLLDANPTGEQIANALRSPYGVSGDTLWVRETWAHDGEKCKPVGFRADGAWGSFSADRVFHYHGWMMDVDGVAPHRKDGRWVGFEYVAGRDGRWRSPIHMPRWASRITLRVKDIRVERLQDISEDDAKAEGLDFMEPNRFSPPDGMDWMPHDAAFGFLWDSINGKKTPWESNPWVWVIPFEREPK